ncbi:uncharacterized protein BDZ99DRAFT_466749 [Mytilinidion resinicola]|uniref:Uncharacterized protein n=1 Tax=Mytilinidion resinicola TaxID=574789 RepID=A0A6A6YAE0_9PEZI|nr:uncharacterized protein BDZ99DRAFT_466749 [Mytilinidion resinicola]KAF2805085.1 hypothetical protein BDZ99DRAFT_466749 [Mytilinidion resinicola]
MTFRNTDGTLWTDDRRFYLDARTNSWVPCMQPSTASTASTASTSSATNTAGDSAPNHNYYNLPASWPPSATGAQDPWITQQPAQPVNVLNRPTPGVPVPSPANIYILLEVREAASRSPFLAAFVEAADRTSRGGL